MTKISLAILFVLVATTASRAERARILVLPLAPTRAIDAGTARTFDARLLVALDDTRRVQTLTHDEDPECTTMKCLADLGADAGAAYVLSLAAVREEGGVTLFGTLVDVKSATAWRRIELPRVALAALAKSAPAQLVPQILGRTGPAVLGFGRPAVPLASAAMHELANRLEALHAFKVAPVTPTDRSPLTHRADVAIGDFHIETPRRALCTWLDGFLAATFSVTDLSTGRVIFSKTVALQVSRRAHFSSEEEVTDLLLGEALDVWTAAFREQGVLKPRR